MQELMAKGVTWRIGSHMYGLNTPKSDNDFLHVWFDRIDHVLPYPAYPDVVELDNNNVKVYSLPAFAKLLVKGNPNISEVAYIPKWSGENDDVENLLMTLVDLDLILHQGTAKAYMGHLNALLSEISRKGITPKRLSHGYRVVYALKHILTEGEMFLLADSRHSKARVNCLKIKTETDPKITAVTAHTLAIDVAEIETLYQTYKESLPTNENLAHEINLYFRELYSASEV
jgi:predicted nucleotidyltransferase